MTVLDDDDIDLVGLLTFILKKNKKPKNKKTRKMSERLALKTKNLRSNVNLLNELRFEPPGFKNYLQMDEDTYRKLLSMVAPLIKNRDTIMRKTRTRTHMLRYVCTVITAQQNRFSILFQPLVQSTKTAQTCRTHVPEELCCPTAQVDLSGKSERVMASFIYRYNNIN